VSELNSIEEIGKMSGSADRLSGLPEFSGLLSINILSKSGKFYCRIQSFSQILPKPDFLTEILQNNSVPVI
jgi:hypothetical protein